MPPKKTSKIRPFLKWAGGKYSIVDKIKKHLPEGKTLIEPFVGAGAVFLNTDYEKYILNDINQDLINLYNAIQYDVDSYVTDAKKFFSEKNNEDKRYYALRDKFNSSVDIYERSLIFLYLNRFGYNGLCRYNQSGGFNVPFGKYKKPIFPQEKIEYFAEKSQKAKFVCEDFKKVFSRARKSHVIYSDPPYAPLSDAAYFSAYSTADFSLDDQERLANAARAIATKGIPIVISNHDTKYTRNIYKGARIVSLDVRRNISCKSNQRVKAKEIIAIFKGDA